MDVNSFVISGASLMKADPFAWLTGGGEMGERIRAFDWSKTSIGSTETWSPALRMMIPFLLANRFPWLLWWGPQYISIYNDAYCPVLGTKHPWALGQPLSQCWKEIWHILQPLVDTPFRGGPATWNDDILLEINRHGFVEETHFTIAYSPVPDQEAPTGIGGVLATVHEITEKVIGERRVSALRELGAATIERKTAEEACLIAAEALAKYTKDIPFALLYLIAPGGNQAHLACATGVDQDSGFCPKVLELGSDARHPWSQALIEVLRTKDIQIVNGLSDHLGDDVPAGPWSDPPQQALVLPIRANVAHQVTGFFIAGVSARLKLDEPYRAVYDLLVNQITTMVANARAYEEERKRAEALAEIDRAKTLFFSNVSHEFRTPLTLMLSPLEEVLAKPPGRLTPDDRSLIDVAHRNSLRLLKLVNSLLDFSRIEAGRAQATYEATDLANLTSDLASNFRSACERAGLRLFIDCPPLIEPVYVDRDMWEKIVLNLLSNAFKFTFEGEIVVRLRESNGQAVLSISDSGVGIPSLELPRVFERFHRIEGQLSRTYEGSGIGLALVQELIKFHKGTIKVESTVGRGTAFTVNIPMGRSHLPSERIGTERTMASTALRAEAYVEEALRWLPDAEFASTEPLAVAVASQSSEGGRILVADDNADMRNYISRLLKSQFDVQAVADGEAALNAVRERLPDLVLADVMMPRLDGLGLVRELRSVSAFAELPVILLSARADEQARLEGLNAGADDYLVKPINAHELVARVGANIKLAKLRQEATKELQYRTAQFETLFNQAPLGVYLVDSELCIREVNPTALATFGDIPGGIIGRNFDEIIHILWPKEYADEVVEIFRQTMKTGESFTMSHKAEVRADRGVMEHYEWRVDRTTLPDGSLGVVCYFRDIAKQVEAENTRQLLLRELNHRVKNTLASVQAIAQQTMRSTKDPEEFTKRFSGRIQSLARVHSLLSEATWQGADLRELIRDQLLHGPIDEARLTAWGPPVYLQPPMALHIGVMLHELGTNSIKYGALLASKGWVTINWTVVNDVLNLQWIERGGPVVSAPSRRGFGTMLIEQSAKSEGGRAEQVIEPEGLTWKISMRLTRAAVRQITDAGQTRFVTPSPSQPQAAVTKPTAPFADWRFLVVEDESLIALDLVDMLEKLGAEEAQAVSNEPECLDLLERDVFDCALLDGNLNGRSVENIAAALTRRKIPFVFVTGYGREGLPAGFQQAPVLAKPVTSEQLVQSVTTRVSKPSSVTRLNLEDARER
jgi:PAS domain S-box-containing protein